MEYINEIIKRNLEDLRKSKGLNLSEVARGAGISQSSYSRFESDGWIAKPEELEKLATFYGVRSSRFFYDPGLDKKEITNTWINRPSPKEITKKLEELIELINK